MWRYAIAGGVGGLAPVGCQVLALFLPNLIGGWDKYPKIMALLPQTTGQWYVCSGVLLAVFLIASGVVLVTLKDYDQRDFGKAFLLGVSVPGMILSFANGASNSEKKLTWNESEHPTSMASRTSGAVALFSSANYPTYLAAGGSPSAEFRVSIKCPECSSNVNLPSLINHLILKTDTNGQTHSVDLPPDRNPTEWLPLPITNTLQPITILVPGYKQAPPQNSQIWRTKESSPFDARAGQQWTIEILLRPGIWNPSRAFFGLPPFYVIETVRANIVASSVPMQKS